MNKEQKIRLDQTKKVFRILAEAIVNGSISYRNLIYDKLGFEGYYSDLIDGLTITNAIFDLEEKDKVIDDTINYIKNSVRKVLIEIDEISEILERGKNEK